MKKTARTGVTVAIAAMLLAGCGPQPNADTQQKIQQAFNSQSAHLGRGMLGGQFRAGKGDSSGYFSMSEFEFTPCEKQNSVAFRFYSPQFGRCTGTFDGQYVSFSVLRDYRRWNEE